MSLVPDGTVKASGSEAKALPDVLKEQISFNLPLESDLYLTHQYITWQRSRCNSPSMLGAMSTPAQMYPSSSRISPDKPEPQPMSRRKAGVFGGRFSNSRARYVMSAWICWMREL